ncbi:acyl carrier protein [Streptomyces sp. AK02-04a]|uniref:acyl carrier protein n=1 Tax=Streptomyces sp. AK02-04a TaxID=3028649 RepID=UPI0029BF6548|nr:acyl carrier protein [Streptomyces sp. AK02-04a]MDX3760029.1 acyl carrier protein [Streptomyces sp. AK02-04a]
MDGTINPKLTDAITELYQIPASEQRPDATLKELGLDSLAAVELNEYINTNISPQNPLTDDDEIRQEMTLTEISAALAQHL